MPFTLDLRMELKKWSLLSHPYYQSWSMGGLEREEIRDYASQYYHHVKAFPRYLSAIHSQCLELDARQILLENLIDEERGEENHPELWLRFAEALGATRAEVEDVLLLPETENLIRTFFEFARSSYAEGLGALYAYEHQIPEIAKFKREALQEFYGLENPHDVKFFEVHEEADIYHSQAIEALLDKLSPEEKSQAQAASIEAAKALWEFLDAVEALRIHPKACVH